MKKCLLIAAMAAASVMHVFAERLPSVTEQTILQWNFGHITGTEVRDATPQQLHGGIFDLAPGQIEVVAEGLFGGTALAFTAGDGRSFVKNDRAAEYLQGGSFTLEVWIRDLYASEAEKTLGRVIAMQRTGGGDKIAWSLGVREGELIFFSNSNMGNEAFSAKVPLPPMEGGNWYKLTFVAKTIGTGEADYTALWQVHETAATVSSNSFTGPAVAILGQGAFTVGGDVAWSAQATRSLSAIIGGVVYHNEALPPVAVP